MNVLVLEIGSVGKGLDQATRSTTFYAHAGGDSSVTKDMLEALQSASDSLGSDNVKIKAADVSNPGIPPSSLMTFLRKVGKKKRRGRRKKKKKALEEEGESGEPQPVPIWCHPPSTIPIQEVTMRRRLGFFAAFFAEGRRRMLFV
ncbi:hypothetical protein B296_00048755 [Ensete ventricosum]|uniref:Uncharacterized protein n=1 Tax=Ensete ventricosum TaxID=4639 RepID=A0A426XLK0_ENSVE|nr:hypothetical protein B296_00048755 [Ensete ventricosum]